MCQSHGMSSDVRNLLLLILLLPFLVCHGEVLEAKLRGTEAEGEKSQPQVGGVYTRVDIERRGESLLLMYAN